MLSVSVTSSRKGEWRARAQETCALTAEGIRRYQEFGQVGIFIRRPIWWPRGFGLLFY